MNNGTNGNARIQALRRREAEIRAQIAAEHEKRRRGAKKDRARLCAIIGELVLQNAAQDAGLASMVKGILQTAGGHSDGDRAFLKAQGWLDATL